jgi:predicted RNase H-like HicB family nuclease
MVKGMTYRVLVTKNPNNGYTARALALPDIVASGTTESEAIEQLRAAIADLQAHSHVVQVDLSLPGEPAENPWLRFAGIWEHDPDWEAFQAAIESYRQEIDAQFPIS